MFTCGDVNTQYLRSFVGKGIGPIASIPLAFTASTILLREVSKIAEDMGRIDKVDLWVLKTACREYVQNIFTLHPELLMTVNISPKC